MVEELTNGTVLYHGSYCKVQKADLNHCKRFKDFGQGFYLTTDKNQAENFALLSSRRAIAAGKIDPSQNYGIVSIFQYQNNEDLKIKIFPEADTDWLHCVVGHRKPNMFNTEITKLETFDVIGGKIADDDTNAAILAYMAETFGPAGSTQADNICISLLLPDRLKDQYCFRSFKALGSLQWIKEEKIWMN